MSVFRQSMENIGVFKGRKFSLPREVLLKGLDGTGHYFYNSRNRLILNQKLLLIYYNKQFTSIYVILM